MAGTTMPYTAKKSADQRTVPYGRTLGLYGGTTKTDSVANY